EYLQIGDHQKVRDGQAQEAQAAPQKQPTAHIEVGPELQHRAQQHRQERQYQHRGHQSCSFLNRKARAKSRTAGDAFSCSMVEMRTRSLRYASSTSSIIASWSFDRE